MKPRMLLTLDEEGALLPAQVRVGQAVDVVAQAGRPKTITGFQVRWGWGRGGAGRGLLFLNAAARVRDCQSVGAALLLHA